MPSGFQRKYGWKFREYRSRKSIISHQQDLYNFDQLSAIDKSNWILSKIRKITLYAQQHNPFYAKHYSNFGFNARSLEKFDDLQKIPIVTKSLLRAAGKNWLQPLSDSTIGNTGGTSGSPLKFVSSRSIGIREKFYMDRVWAKIGCDSSHNRAIFRGINLELKNWEYNPISDGYIINAYKPFDDMVPELLHLFRSKNIHFLHGYPSAIYQFALFVIQNNQSELLHYVISHLKGILFGSEYPTPQYRSVIESAFPVKTISWYGHSEKIILASEKSIPYVYEPFHSYGYCEGVPCRDKQIHLVGTCYDNFASPFIRYDTEDSIQPMECKNGLLKSFKIKHGRTGEFILDKNNHPVSLTSLIFGRHHKAFEIVDFVQVSQNHKGQAIIHITTKSKIPHEQLSKLFDLTNIDIEFNFLIQEKPIKTKSGKVSLLIPYNNHIRKLAMEIE